jgi:hypothetical protein
MGMVAGSTLLAILPLMSVKWWCYLEEQTNGRRWPLINHLLAPVVAIITPLIFIGGAEYIRAEIVLLSLATGAVFLPSGQLRWFWQQRFRDLKIFPDSGQVTYILSAVAGGIPNRIGTAVRAILLYLICLSGLL